MTTPESEVAHRNAIILTGMINRTPTTVPSGLDETTTEFDLVVYRPHDYEPQHRMRVDVMPLWVGVTYVELITSRAGPAAPWI